MVFSGWDYKQCVSQIFFYIYLQSMHTTFVVGKNKYYFKYNTVEGGGLKQTNKQQPKGRSLLSFSLDTRPCILCCGTKLKVQATEHSGAQITATDDNILELEPCTLL